MSEAFPSDFHPAIIEWFRKKFGEPTQPQKQGWPLISQGLNTLILAPTGSGKTLAAFLAGINRVLCDLETGSGPGKGVEILYISPLKALNYDIEKNLSEPLREIQETARAIGRPLPEITTGVRTGDTPANERRKMIKKPPHILITTPESLHIMLTSSARQMLETVRYLIVDEIHSLSPNKRGVFLSILLERLEEICRTSPVRIGLSATQKPLSEVASFLGGFDDTGNPRPVEIIDTGVRRKVDLKVVCTCDDLRKPEECSVWPSIFRRLLDLVQSHRSTIIFANTRRVVEKLTIGINDLASEEIVQPHHGSVSAVMRRRIEAALKNGSLKGVVATGTLELGIDMGAVELVCQVESPKEVSRGLQRVGRAGHVHTAVSKGRIVVKTNPDLAETVSIAQGMLEGDVEPISVPKNCLDVLAQQIVAMAALDGTLWTDVYQTMKRTYSFHELPEEAFNLTLQMVSGRYPSKAFKDLRPRVSLDRVSGKISPLPGSQRLVISNGGAIPDTGEYGVYLAEANIKIGELDEEFVYESREGDTFSLGTNNWKIVKIDANKVLVKHGSPMQVRMPFWRGENVPRSAGTGRRMGAMLREIEERGDEAEKWILDNFPVDIRSAQNLCHFAKVQSGLAAESGERRAQSPDDEKAEGRERRAESPDDKTRVSAPAEPASAAGHRSNKNSRNSGLPTDKRIVLESFLDDLGGRRLALLSVFGGRIHQALRIAISALMKRELGVIPETISGDNGVLYRVPDSDAQPPYDLLRMLTPDLAYDLITNELPDTPLFGLRFRQNAARALLLPGAGPGKRTPLWLQRLKAKDLLQIAKSFDGFPIVVETFRECLRDYLDLEELNKILQQIQSGEIKVSIVERQTPSPLVATMLFDFQMIYQYEWDQPKSSGKRRSTPVERRLVDELVDGKLGKSLDERAITDLDNRLQGIGEHSRARTAEELYETVRRLGDIPEDNAAERCMEPEFIDALLEEGRLVKVTLGTQQSSIDGAGFEIPPQHKLVACDHLDEYLQAVSGDKTAIENILDRHISNRAIINPLEIVSSYGFPAEIVENMVKEMANEGALVEIPPAPDSTEQRWTSPENLESIYRRTLAVQKLEAKPASAEKYSEFLTRWQHLHPEHKLRGQEGVRSALRQLEAAWLPYSVWEPDILARRIIDFHADQIDNVCLSAEFIWTGQSSGSDKPGAVAFLAREGLPALYPLLHDSQIDRIDDSQREAVRCSLRERGASFVIDLVLETGLDSRIVQRILWEMIWSGEVTHDYFKILRSGKPPAVSLPESSPNSGRAADRKQFYRTRSRIARSFSHPPERNPGRWVLLQSLSGQHLDEYESLEIYARVLLERYGVVARDLVKRAGEPDVFWNELYQIYQRMELSGEIERGYFVDGLAGAQFGLPEAIDDLLGRTRTGWMKPSGDKHTILINSCDPAYLFSASGPFDIGFGRCNRLPSNYAILVDGVPTVTVELGSKTLKARDDLEPESLSLSLAALPGLVDSPWPIRPYRKVELTTFNNGSIFGSPIEKMLHEVGFEEESNSLVLRSAVV